jgi:hypothetical protein
MPISCLLDKIEQKYHVVKSWSNLYSLQIQIRIQIRTIDKLDYKDPEKLLNPEHLDRFIIKFENDQYIFIKFRYIVV